jgi:hypothetical protein
MINAISRLVARISVKTFTASYIDILPELSCGREPGCWGYPGCVWVSVGWLLWSVQVSMYARPCEQCIGYKRDATAEEVQG